MRKVIATNSAQATREVAGKLAEGLRVIVPNRVVVLHLFGELGAGKTTFVSGVLKALGVEGAIRSPTYTLLEPYDLNTMRVYHLDLYRLAGEGELEMLGLRDLLAPNALVLIEWADRGGRAVPPADVEITLRYPGFNASDFALGDAREIHLSAVTPIGDLLMAELLARTS